MYFFGLSKEEVLSQKHGVSKQNPISMVTLFGRQVFPVKREIVIDLEEPLTATNWDGKRNPKVVIDLEELPTTELTDSVRNPETSDKEECLLDLNRIPVDEVVSEPHYCFLQDLNCPYIEETEISCEKSGVDDDLMQLCSPKSQNVHEKDSTASPASDTSCCTTENNLITESRRSSSPRALEPSCRTRLEFPDTEVLPTEELSEMIQMAAESLVHISATSYQNQDLQSKITSQDQDFLERCSCDSYELHTLQISETNTEEDFSVSSMALDELNNITRDNNKEIGLKLRRGRRMKNFQKEILPSLASLSRHEIREDVNILEAVLRSKEYKKMQGKTKDVKFEVNLRNKRSTRQRNVGKRRRKIE